MLEHNTNYFIINDIKYVVIYENKNKLIYRDDFGKLCPLTDDERLLIEKMFKSNNDYIYYSERLSDIVYNGNNHLYATPGIELLENVERFIPDNYKEDFYKRLESLTISYENQGRVEKFEKVYNAFFAEYKTKLHEIHVYPENIFNHIKNNTNVSEENYDIEYRKTLNHTVLHELIHAISTKYDKEEKIAYVGFDRSPHVNDENDNVALTEGFTEFLAREAIKYDYGVVKAYEVEVNLVKQISLLIGIEPMLDSYFGNKGIIMLRSRLNDLSKDTSVDYLNDTISWALFRRIEDYFNMNQIGMDDTNDYLYTIQEVLLHYLHAKCEKLESDNKYDSIDKLLNLYERCLITNEMAEKEYMHIKNDNLDDNINTFNKIKKTYQNDSVR